jgi:3-oxoacyl-[acyl-carrier protein] reductase
MTNGNLKGRTALVTGSSRGIGADIARKLSACGARVAVHASKNFDQAETLAKELGNARAFQADLSTADGPAEVVRQVFETFGEVDILVNNAGVFGQGEVEKISVEDFERLFHVNVRALAVATREFATRTKSRNGRIVNISSIAARFPAPGTSLYAASKAAVESLTRSHALELGARGITVNCVAPGTTLTDMVKEGLPEEGRRVIGAAGAFGRLGEPEDVANAVTLLCFDEASWVTGQIVGADGGQPGSAGMLMRVARAVKAKHAE